VGSSLLLLLQAAATAVATASPCRSDSVCSPTLQHTRAESQFKNASNSRHHNICCPCLCSSVGGCGCVVMCCKDMCSRAVLQILHTLSQHITTAAATN
jgi:hypothetical protein